MNNKRKNEMGYSSPTNNLWIVMGWESCNWAGIGHYLLGRAVAWREEPASIFSWEQIAPDQTNRTVISAAKSCQRAHHFFSIPPCDFQLSFILVCLLRRCMRLDLPLDKKTCTKLFFLRPLKVGWLVPWGWSVYYYLHKAHILSVMHVVELKRILSRQHEDRWNRCTLLAHVIFQHQQLLTLERLILLKISWHLHKINKGNIKRGSAGEMQTERNQ
jgi:hypothetical protein